MNVYVFFDTIGLAVFAFLFFDAVIELREPNRHTWRVYARLLIGIAGLVVDGFLVFVY